MIGLLEARHCPCVVPSNSLTILPVSGLDLSLTIVILAGVGVLLYLSEALGWVFGGLIIPGYLGSILAISPAAGFTIAVEALATLLLALGLSEGLGRLGAWTPFFGRDRFLLVVLLSVIVRQQAETWVLPWALAAAAAAFGHPILPADEVHSIGLVLVPLIANALWKTGWRSGFSQVIIPTALAFWVLDRVLLGRTNLSLGFMAMAYEDPALDFLGSARAYVLLLTGAILASRFMLRFGWNAGGILIPALLGLAFLEPARLVGTALETTLLVLGWRALVRLPGLRALNLEGGRRLAILFAMAALLRVGLSWAAVWGVPLPSGLGAGFGYLISSLMAAKILQFGSFGQVLLPAFGTAALGFGLGTGAVWAIEQTLPPTPPPADPGGTPPTIRLLRSPEGVMRWARARTRLDLARAPSVSRPAGERLAWRELLEEVQARLNAHDLTGLADSLPPGLRLSEGPALGGQPTWILAEADERPDALIGWGALLLRPAGEGPAILVDHPWLDAASVSAAPATCEALDCALIGISGVDAARSFAGWELVHEVFGPSSAPIDASAPALPAPPVAELRGLGAWLDAQVEAAVGAWSPSPAEALVLSEDLIPALRAASSGGDVEAASRAAGQLGLSVLRVDDLVALAPIEPGPVLVLGGPDSRPVLVEVPNPGPEVGTLRIGLALFRALNASALLVDPAPAEAPGAGRSSSFYAAHLALRPLITGREGALALTVRGLGASSGAALPEDLVIGVGVPVTADPPAAVASLFGAGGPLADRWTLRWATSGPSELGLSGAQIPSVGADRVLGGLEPAVLWFSAHARQSWTTRTRAEQAAWLGGAGITLTDADAAAPAGERGPTPRGGPNISSLNDLLSRARQQHNVNLLRAAAQRVAGTPGASLTAGWDDARGYAFLDLEVAGSGAVSRSRVPLVDGELLTVEADFARPGALEDALAAGAVALVGTTR